MVQAALLVSILAVVPSIASADPLSIGPESSVAAVDGANDLLAGVARTNDGGWVALATRYTPLETPGGYRYYLPSAYIRRFDPTGLPSGSEIGVAPLPADGAYYYGYALVSLADGGFAVMVSRILDPDDGNSGLYLQRFSATGELNGSPEIFLPPYSGLLYVASRPGGGFVALRNRDYAAAGEPARCGVIARVYDGNADPYPDEVIVIEPPLTGSRACFSNDPDYYFSIVAAARADGGFIVAWLDGDSPYPSSAVLARSFSSNGAPHGDAFVVSYVPSGAQVDPSVAAGAGGTFAVAWVEDRSRDADEADVFARVFDATGVAITEKTRVNEFTRDYQSDPSLAYDTTDTFVIAWETYKGGRRWDTAEIRVRRFDTNATPLGPETPVNANRAGAQSRAVAVGGPDGRTLIAWRSRVGNDVVSHVSAQLFTNEEELSALCPSQPLPASECRELPSLRSSLALKPGTTPSQSVLRWKWSGGGASTSAALGNPFGTTTVYRICVYDSSASSQPLQELKIRPGGVCHKRGNAKGYPCWVVDGNDVTTFNDRAGRLDGVRSLRLTAGGDGAAGLTVLGRGGELELPVLPLAAPVTIQLFAQDGSDPPECWSSSFPTLKRNGATALLARQP